MTTNMECSWECGATGTQYMAGRDVNCTVTLEINLLPVPCKDYTHHTTQKSNFWMLSKIKGKEDFHTKTVHNSSEWINCY